MTTTSPQSAGSKPTVSPIGRTVVPEERRVYSSIPELHELPNLIRVQSDSYGWFLKEGLKQLFQEISPIQDFTGKRMELLFDEYRLGDPQYSEHECRQRDLTYSAPLRVTVQLVVKESGEIKEQELFFGDFPLMTSTGTFVINGAERVVVSQLVRSPGAYFSTKADPNTGRELCSAKLIPNRGAWLEFETSNRDLLTVKVDRKRKIPITTLLRAIDSDEEIEDETLLGTDERVRAMLEEWDTNPLHPYLEATLAKEPAPGEGEERTKAWALLEVYRKLRPGDPPTADNARGLLDSLFFNPRRYDLGRVGRYKVNKRLAHLLDGATDQRTLRQEDMLAIVKQQIRINNSEDRPDDIDHLGNRRIRAVGELILNQFRVGLLRMERVIRERMTITDPEQATPSALINIRPVVAAMKEFFGGSQLSQFMDQTNPLAELTHKRRLSALGPGGLSRDRAGFDVRDVHHSHYGRICPIETPEGPNIGLIGSLATFGVINGLRVHPDALSAGGLRAARRISRPGGGGGYQRMLRGRVVGPSATPETRSRPRCGSASLPPGSTRCRCARTWRTRSSFSPRTKRTVSSWRRLARRWTRPGTSWRHGWRCAMARSSRRPSRTRSTTWMCPRGRSSPSRRP